MLFNITAQASLDFLNISISFQNNTSCGVIKVFNGSCTLDKIQISSQNFSGFLVYADSSNFTLVNSSFQNNSFAFSNNFYNNTNDYFNNTNNSNSSIYNNSNNASNDSNNTNNSNYSIYNNSNNTNNDSIYDGSNNTNNDSLNNNLTSLFVITGNNSFFLLFNVSFMTNFFENTTNVFLIIGENQNITLQGLFASNNNYFSISIMNLLNSFVMVQDSFQIIENFNSFFFFFILR